MKKIFLLLLPYLFCSLGCTAQKAIRMKSVEAQNFIKNNKELVIIDVRTPEEFEEGHLKGAINIDVKKSDFEEQIAKLDTSKTYLVYCRSGRRSAGAVRIMHNKNFKSLYEISDGFMGWTNKGLPVEK
ncbi:MAG: rhodanese-like domain-containing protein [Porphyromonadaceae bacterium]|nr:rhodanese-like domain-containing protein [Porphyromonadaceae bacterium]